MLEKVSNPTPAASPSAVPRPVPCSTFNVTRERISVATMSKPLAGAIVARAFDEEVIPVSAVKLAVARAAIDVVIASEAAHSVVVSREVERIVAR